MGNCLNFVKERRLINEEDSILAEEDFKTYLLQTKPSLQALYEVYGEPNKIYQNNKHYISRSMEEDMWLVGRYNNVYRKFQWNNFTVFTYKFSDGSELIWEIVSYI